MYIVGDFVTIDGCIWHPSVHQHVQRCLVRFLYVVGPGEAVCAQGGAVVYMPKIVLACLFKFGVHGTVINYPWTHPAAHSMGCVDPAFTSIKC